MPYVLKQDVLQRQIRRQWLIQGIIAAGLTVLLLFLLMGMLSMLLPAMLIVLTGQSILAVRRMSRLRKDWESYRILYYEDGLQLMARYMENVIVYREDVYSVEVNEQGELELLAADCRAVLVIPAALDRFDSLRRKLEGWCRQETAYETEPTMIWRPERVQEELAANAEVIPEMQQPIVFAAKDESEKVSSEPLDSVRDSGLIESEWNQGVTDEERHALLGTSAPEFRPADIERRPFLGTAGTAAALAASEDPHALRDAVSFDVPGSLSRSRSRSRGHGRTPSRSSDQAANSTISQVERSTSSSKRWKSVMGPLFSVLAGFALFLAVSIVLISYFTR